MSFINAVLHDVNFEGLQNSKHDNVQSWDVHTKSLEVSFVYVISDLCLFGIQSSALIN